MEPPGQPRADETPSGSPAPNTEADAVRLGEPAGAEHADTSRELGESSLEAEVASDPDREATAPAADQPAAPVDLSPKAAVWAENDPGEWFPEGFRPHLGILNDYRYEDHFQCEAAGFPGWKILAGTRRGRMHAHRGRHREDALRFSSGRNFTVLCVSDGAGAYQYSRVGSEVTCRTVIASLEKALNGNAPDLAELDREALTKRVAEAILDATKAALTALEELARETVSSPKDFRCTLLTAVFYLGARAQVALTSQVGDGFFAGLNRDGQARRYGSSDSGAYSGEVTCFVPDPETLNHAARIRSIEIADLEALMLCTDGIEDPFYPLEKNAANIFRQLYQGEVDLLPGFEANRMPGPVIGDPAACERLAQWLAFEKKGENDDRTMVILHRDPVVRGWKEIKPNEIAGQASNSGRPPPVPSAVAE